MLNCHFYRKISELFIINSIYLLISNSIFLSCISFSFKSILFYLSCNFFSSNAIHLFSISRS
ncbi:hypothetical protein C1645_787222 [Glomus cerebriforme]|uniref:Uncharacterized protein n=1 Tax=Glomus cerebriforme TaxID=658196 RepID=A0A397S9N7_9GLOM|nr:hypothetical protein C1645_787222 [Glomus cerebriforme]